VSTKLKLYVAAVVATALALLAWLFPGVFHPPGGGRQLADYALWVAICAFSESLWLPALSGTGTVTMASTAGLTTAVLWGPGPAAWIVAVSTLIAELFILKKPAVRALFNTSQAAITILAAGMVFVLLGGPAEGLEVAGPMPGRELVALRLVAPILGLFVVYLLVNRALVAVAVAWSTERAYLRVLREDWFFPERLIEDAAAFMMSPLMVISFKSIGYAGAVLFYAPLRILNESHRRYLELRSAQQQIIHTERMAAKGEMAAEIGHELRNQLAAISGRAQLLLKDADKQKYDGVARHVQIILEQSDRMRKLSDGMMDFSHKELKIERVELNALIHRSIEFVRSQNRFDGVEWDLQLFTPAPELRADPGQLQQVLLNLFMNAADAMKENGTPRKSIAVECSQENQKVRIVVRDTGVGIPASNLSKIFEPHFTTKPTGHGFGLSTSYRIIQNHGGKIVAESPPGRGACFTITLPVQGPGGWN
jgi:signal transduction histidine kinase